MRDAEVGIDFYDRYNYIRNFTPKPLPTLEVSSSSGGSGGGGSGQGSGFGLGYYDLPLNHLSVPWAACPPIPPLLSCVILIRE